jgi:anti-sigma-K factor RskA
VTGLRRLTCETVDELAPLYVLGALDANETAAVRGHLASCGRPHEELATLGGVVPYLAEAVPQVEPPPELGGRIRAAVDADLRARRRDDSAAERLVSSLGAARPAPREAALPERAQIVAPPVVQPAATSPAPVDLAERPRSGTATQRLRPFLELAAVLLIVVLGGWNLLLQGQVGGLRERDEQLRAAVVAAGRPDSTVARVGGGEGAPEAGGFAVLRPNEPGYLVVTGLPVPPAGHTYQAWYIEDGTPRSAGLMEVGADGTAVMRGLRASPTLQAVALTQERSGGSPTPNGAVYAIGELGG